MKKLLKLLLLQVMAPALFLITIHGNSNGNPLCPNAFDSILEDQALDLAIRAEELLGQSKIYNNQETRNLASDIWTYFSKWESAKGEALFLHSEFTAFKESVDRLEALLNPPRHSDMSRPPSSVLTPNRPITSQRSSDLLNIVIESNTPIESNKIYTVKSSHHNYEFHVIFLPEIVELINQNRTDIKVKKSMNALLKGPINDVSGTTGIKKILRHRDLFEIKIMGKKGIGNFRIGIFLYNGVYYIAKYTHQHVERERTFIEALRRGLSQATNSNDLVYAP